MCDSAVLVGDKVVDPSEQKNNNSELPDSGEPETSEKE